MENFNLRFQGETAYVRRVVLIRVNNNNIAKKRNPGLSSLILFAHPWQKGTYIFLKAIKEGSAIGR